MRVRIGLIQQKAPNEGSSSKDKAKGLENAVKGIEEAAAKKGADIVCLQELFLSWYLGQTKDKARFNLAESIPGPSTEALGHAARKNNVYLIGGSIFEKDGRDYYNTSVVFDNSGKIVGKYRKNHIPNDPYYWEQFYFKKGNLGYPVFDTDLGKIAVLICYDQWFPEAARAAALKGAKIIFYPTAIGWTNLMRKDPDEKNALKNWIDMQRMHAVANHVYVAAVNRVGKESYVGHYIDFWGNSFVADPFGNIVARADKKENVLIAYIDDKKIEKAKTWRFMEERRPDTYGILTK